MIHPICVTCELEFTVKKNGVFAIETAREEPYKIWSADLLECSCCHAQIVSGFSLLSVSKQESEFKATLAAALNNPHVFVHERKISYE